jgi:hypothetical protein
LRGWHVKWGKRSEGTTLFHIQREGKLLASQKA